MWLESETNVIHRYCQNPLVTLDEKLYKRVDAHSTSKTHKYCVLAWNFLMSIERDEKNKSQGLHVYSLTNVYGKTIVDYTVRW